MIAATLTYVRLVTDGPTGSPTLDNATVDFMTAVDLFASACRPMAHHGEMWAAMNALYTESRQGGPMAPYLSALSDEARRRYHEMRGWNPPTAR